MFKRHAALVLSSGVPLSNWQDLQVWVYMLSGIPLLSCQAACRSRTASEATCSL